ncbi:NtaA/DmoA family FMN-dependent monooxygenase [Leifsonia sp. H3M29-4]|uniref:NtaA/DmoA family FMN-dependent monooxygenase n=1 Tax=Salinibacterium metalliresistens TaxID=3031321 RepID=UPI0023DAAB3B|nr:NtaA/DmoA family FMN-dependent monooxygenase [Salinibacterium metalliresistens]MDF1478258.1 NtaA/DmoA family FMN-dependent monooxygenase [Salinibacterium metalliresistens]
MPQRPRMLFSAFNEFVLSHHDQGLWAHPKSRQLELNSVEYWVEIARLLERAHFDLLFFADVLATYDIYQGKRDAAVLSGMQTPINDPAVLAPVLAYATEHLGIVVTENVLQEHPYSFARKMTTLDHLSKGRVGWNIVTSFLPGAGRNLGFGGLPTHEERYARADDYMNVVYKLWEASWEDDAVIRDIANQRYVDPSKIHEINHVGPYYDVVGPHISEPSPQRTPVLFQAAASDVGIDFAGRHAEVLFTSLERSTAAANIARLRGEAVAAGRRPEDVRIFGGFAFVLGSTEEEARRLDDEFREAQSLDAAFAKFSAFWQFDLDLLPRRAKLTDILNGEVANDAVKKVARFSPDLDWTLEDFVRWIGSRRVVGTPEQVVREIEDWQDLGVDGLNISYVISPGTYEDFAEHLTPLLLQRGLMRHEYSPGTLREKLFGKGPNLPDEHPARRVRRDALAAS